MYEGEPRKTVLEIPKSELWLLSFYRSSEIHGSLLFGKIARRMEDPDLRIFLTRHFSDEARHAWVWTQAIVDVGGVPEQIPDVYQNRYAAEAGIPKNIVELLALTQVFERRVISQYTAHMKRPDVHPRVRAAFEDIMKDERWHLSWINEKLQQIQKERGPDEVRAALEHYTAIDRKVYASVSADASEVEQRLRDLPLCEL